MIRPWNHAATVAAACLALLAMIFSVSCSSTSTDADGLPSHLPEIQLSGSTDTPPHSMASYEYPFDSGGRYVSSWAAEGERRAGRSASATSADSSKWSKSHGGAASSKKVASSSSKSKTSSKAKAKPKSSGTSSTVASSSGGGSGSSSKGSTTTKAKPKPESSGSDSTVASSSGNTDGSSEVTTSTKAKPKPPSSGSYTVKAGDTVERIARRHGTTTKKLMAANGMTSDFLKIGRVLKLP